MSDVVSWMVEVSIKSGQLDNFKAFVEEQVQSTRKEPNTLAYEPVPQTPLPSRGQSLKLVTTEDGGGRDGLSFDALGPRARIPDAAFPTGMAAGGGPGLVHPGRG